MQRNLHPGIDFLHPNSQDAEPGCMLAKLSFVRQVVCFSDPKWGPSWSLLTRLYVSLVYNVGQVGFCWPGCMFLGSRMLAELAFVYQAVCFFDLKC